MIKDISISTPTILWDRATVASTLNNFNSDDPMLRPHTTACSDSTTDITVASATNGSAACSVTVLFLIFIYIYLLPLVSLSLHLQRILVLVLPQL